MIDSKADPYNLQIVVMPLVRVMKDAHITWASRTEVAWAIQETMRQHRLLMEEHYKFGSENSCQRDGL